MNFTDTYETNNIFISTNHPFTWKQEIRERIEYMSETTQFIITAPHGTGKTEFVEEIAADFASAKNDVLVVTDTPDDADKMAFVLGLMYSFNMKHQKGSYLMHNDKGTILIPRTKEDLDDILLNESDIDIILADGCESYNNEKLHCLALKGSLYGALLILVGAEEEFGKTHLNKSVWEWFLNHPSCDVNRVIACDTVKSGEINAFKFDSGLGQIFGMINRPCVA